MKTRKLRKNVYEHYCVLCSGRKITPKLCLAVTERGKKISIAVMLENYCRINVTTENVPQLHLCLLQELKLQAIVSKVDNFQEKWMGKDNINRQQPFRVNVRCLALMSNSKATRGHLPPKLEKSSVFSERRFPKGPC